MADFSEKFYDSIIHLDKYISFWVSIIALLTTFAAIYTIRTWRKEHIEKMRINLLMEVLECGEKIKHLLMHLYLPLYEPPGESTVENIKDHIEQTKRTLSESMSDIKAKHADFIALLQDKKNHYSLLFDDTISPKNFNPFREFEKCFSHIYSCQLHMLSNLMILESKISQEQNVTSDYRNHFNAIIEHYASSSFSINTSHGCVNMLTHVINVTSKSYADAKRRLEPGFRLKILLLNFFKLLIRIYRVWIVLLRKMHKDLEHL